MIILFALGLPVHQFRPHQLGEQIVQHLGHQGVAHVVAHALHGLLQFHGAAEGLLGILLAHRRPDAPGDGQRLGDGPWGQELEAVRDEVLALVLPPAPPTAVVRGGGDVPPTGLEGQVEGHFAPRGDTLGRRPLPALVSAALLSALIRTGTRPRPHRIGAAALQQIVLHLGGQHIVQPKVGIHVPFRQMDEPEIVTDDMNHPLAPAQHRRGEEADTGLGWTSPRLLLPLVLRRVLRSPGAVRRGRRGGFEVHRGGHTARPLRDVEHGVEQKAIALLDPDAQLGPVAVGREGSAGA
mmetsp:Transcript_19258/g.56145  ORF Transcript_19258/g.56145 Transcript_19258/m.56145 type:complete len:295 (+) Transcript_19258:2256-3140(+)